MIFNRIIYTSIKDKLYFYSVLPCLEKRYMCSKIDERGRNLLHKISEKDISENYQIKQRKINFEESEEIDDEDIEMEDMFCQTSKGKEWGGPMRGGRYNEPTRFGDWERKGRCTDF